MEISLSMMKWKKTAVVYKDQKLGKLFCQLRKKIIAHEKRGRSLSDLPN